MEIGCTHLEVAAEDDVPCQRQKQGDASLTRPVSDNLNIEDRQQDREQIHRSLCLFALVPYAFLESTTSTPTVRTSTSPKLILSLWVGVISSRLQNDPLRVFGSSSSVCWVTSFSPSEWSRVEGKSGSSSIDLSESPVIEIGSAREGGWKKRKMGSRTREMDRLSAGPIERVNADWSAPSALVPKCLFYQILCESKTFVRHESDL